ncbi:MraZ protein [Bifidobacterium bohemicum]|uniref:Transcriptional regulator MraZ n=1 Tax=Bifidobacterium bohemicum DSM 22767 TaxID=1437606 RepID=A0A086ZGG0_9BIFI|nr:division/cell wall cluster transcriptional repressor MraZ [Bifidobacterium bohemicum]KFI45610.1 protein mraZ [Bifidobacterium bohemicum DSM 22767]SCC00698.1 MraZ protein [Bifidobacterium bohemicum]
MVQYDENAAMPPFGNSQNADSPTFDPRNANASAAPTVNQFGVPPQATPPYASFNPGANPSVQASMPLLLGTYTPKMDVKGRMALPAKFRSELGPGMVMARGQERCVYLLPQNEFRRIAARIQRTSMGNKAARDYLRVFLSGAVDQEPDKQGRVLVPQNLRDYANLGSSVTVIGVGTRAEIWNSEAWQAYLTEKEEGYADIADDVLPAMEW